MAATLCKPIVRETTPRASACKLCLECDEMWSFVGHAKEKVWVWLALDRDSREVLGVAFVKRDGEGARALWNSLPAVYRQCAVCYTDYWEVYKKVLPSKRHKAVSKKL